MAKIASDTTVANEKKVVWVDGGTREAKYTGPGTHVMAGPKNELLGPPRLGRPRGQIVLFGKSLPKALFTVRSLILRFSCCTGLVPAFGKIRMYYVLLT